MTQRDMRTGCWLSLSVPFCLCLWPGHIVQRVSCWTTCSCLAEKHVRALFVLPAAPDLLGTDFQILLNLEVGEITVQPSKGSCPLWNIPSRIWRALKPVIVCPLFLSRTANVSGEHKLRLDWFISFFDNIILTDLHTPILPPHPYLPLESLMLLWKLLRPAFPFSHFLVIGETYRSVLIHLFLHMAAPHCTPPAAW